MPTKLQRLGTRGDVRKVLKLPMAVAAMQKKTKASKKRARFEWTNKDW